MRPETVTVIPVPTDEVANAPTAEAVLRVTESPRTTPVRVAPLVFKATDVVPSYGLLAAVIPETVKFFAVMFAVVVGSMRE